jgi:uncharacterized LabA/DUF88 family protein
VNKHKAQRVGVFIDVQNLYYSAKQFYHAKVNFAHILKTAVSGRQLIRAIAYVIKADIKEESNFFDALTKIGYDVRSKDLQTFYTGAKKGDWDVGIAMDIMRMADKLDVVVLVSGDGDFKDLLEHCKALGCRTEVIAFKKTTSSRLFNEAEEFHDLGKELNKSLIKDHTTNGKSVKAIMDAAPKNVMLEQEVKPTGKPMARPVNKSTRPVNKTVSRAPTKYNNNNNNNSRDRKPFQPRNNGRSFERKPVKPFERRSNNFERNDNSEASLLQRLNMEQPLDKVAKKPVVKKPVVKNVVKPKPTKKVTKKTTANKKPEAKKTITKKPTVKKSTTKKKTPKKKESLVEKVIKKVTNKSKK